MPDVAIVALIVGLGVAGLIYLFKRAAQQDARDARSQEDESRRG